ncbi:hypothetical protein SAMN05216582_12916 [Selenomonas ruminantium]|uniref:Uncharacterized protein n=1 Tax=Selenomonas ruminantium TaxID=971 RepID=A0A1M6WYI5_SELRU|nr:hypothetical protein [Selenomonas ruminantium]SHK98733.1 hypothetical protein SAMN05216582_12916 [Selenomonas ruminantium]
MDVRSIDSKSMESLLPHRHEEVLKSQQNRLLGIINAVKTGDEDVNKGLPPLHTLLSRLDALQGSQELENSSWHSSPAFDVDIRHGEEQDPFAQDAYVLDLQYYA